MPSTNLIDSTRRYLTSYYIFVSETWLTECLEFFLGSLTESDINTIQSNVKEQYYLNDLRDIGKGCLPPNLKSHKEMILPNKYILQINSIIDIGKPAYQQYMELKKVDLGNIEATKTYEEKIRACRMLKLNMTDGVQEVVGIEYRTIKSLHTNIPPGYKVLIQGPVKCKNGLLLLEEKNLVPLDGEVDVLMEVNSQLMVLERQLRSYDPEKIRAITSSTSITQPSRSEVTSVNPILPSESVSSISGNTENISTNPSNYNTRDPKLQSTFGLQTDSSLPGPSGMVPGRSRTLETILIEDDDFQDMDIDVDPQEIDKIEAQFSEKLNSTDDIVMPPEKRLKIDRNDEFPDDDDLAVLQDYDEEHFSDIDESEIFKEKDTVDIKDINKINEKSFKKFTVRAKIANIRSKLSVTRDRWKLSCNITDDTDNLDVNFSNEVLEKVIGYTPKEMYELKKQIKTQPDLKERGSLIIAEAKEKFKNFNCKMKIEFASDSNIPTVTELIDYY